MSLEELTCSELVALCQKVGVIVTYLNKTELVERLHKHYETAFTATPDKEFFLFMRNMWKEVKVKKKQFAQHYLLSMYSTTFGG